MGYDRSAVLRERAEREAAGLPLFGDKPWPETRPATVEQGALALPGATIRGNYVLWLGTAEGRQVYHAFCAAAAQDARAGIRLSAKGITERVRAFLKLEINNSFVSLMVRDAETDHPELHFEKRARHAT